MHVGLEKKSYDHTNLDIARINYTKTMTNETMSELAKNRLLVASLEQKVRESEDALKEIFHINMAGFSQFERIRLVR